MFQWHSCPKAHDIHLAHVQEWHDQLNGAFHRCVHGASHRLEECGRGVRKRVGSQGSQSQGADTPQVAHQNGLGEKENISAGQEDSLVGGIAGWNSSARQAPVVAIKVAHRLCQFNQGQNAGASKRGQKAAAMGRLIVFPVQAAADINRLNHPVPCPKTGENGAVEASADQNGGLGDGAVTVVRGDHEIMLVDGRGKTPSDPTVYKLEMRCGQRLGR